MRSDFSLITYNTNNNTILIQRYSSCYTPLYTYFRPHRYIYIQSLGPTCYITLLHYTCLSRSVKDIAAVTLLCTLILDLIYIYIYNIFVRCATLHYTCLTRPVNDSSSCYTCLRPHSRYKFFVRRATLHRLHRVSDGSRLAIHQIISIHLRVPLLSPCCARVCMLSILISISISPCVRFILWVSSLY